MHLSCQILLYQELILPDTPLLPFQKINDTLLTYRYILIIKIIGCFAYTLPDSQLKIPLDCSSRMRMIDSGDALHRFLQKMLNFRYRIRSERIGDSDMWNRRMIDILYIKKLPVNQNRPSGNLLLATLNQKSYNLFVSRKHSSSL